MATGKRKSKGKHPAQLDGNRWRVLYRTSGGKRKYHYLGRSGDEISQRDADALALSFLASLGVDPGRRDRGKAPMLREWIARYRGQRDGKVSPATLAYEESTSRYITGFFGEDVRIDQITKAQASDWEAAYRMGKLDHLRGGERQNQKGQKSESTVCSQVCNVKTMFNAAVKQEVLAKNPFAHLSTKPPAQESDWHFITREELKTLLDATQSISPAWGRRRPQAGIFWKAAIALARLGGLRRSEILEVKVADVVLKGAGEAGLSGITVYNHKTRRKATSRPYRFVPMNAELQQVIVDAIAALETGERYVVARKYISSPHTLTNGISAVFQRAGLNGGKAWPEFFQSCRRSRATELAENGVPLTSHCEVLGHTPQVAQQFYLKTRSHVLEQIASI